jgi:hypothetical protein
MADETDRPVRRGAGDIPRRSDLVINGARFPEIPRGRVPDFDDQSINPQRAAACASATLCAVAYREPGTPGSACGDRTNRVSAIQAKQD